MRGDVRAGKKLTLDERFVNALTQPLDVRRVDEELAAEQRGRVSEGQRAREEERQHTCSTGSAAPETLRREPRVSAQEDLSETRFGSTSASVPALTSMSVMTCHRSIATTHLLSRRRQLRVLCQYRELARDRAD